MIEISKRDTVAGFLLTGAFVNVYKRPFPFFESNARLEFLDVCSSTLVTKGFSFCVVTIKSIQRFVVVAIFYVQLLKYIGSTKGTQLFQQTFHIYKHYIN